MSTVPRTIELAHKDIKLNDDGDSVYNSRHYNIRVEGGKSNDFIYNSGYEGNDYILNTYHEYTNNGGAGNDTIENSGTNYVLFKYAEGDGNDSIIGFNENSTLQIGGGKDTYTREIVGKDIIVTFGKGQITLDGTTVTVAKSSLNAENVTVSDGYTLALADDVTKPTTTKAAWSLKSSTATYKSSAKTEGYTLARDGKSITYSKATSAKTLATVKGVKSLDGLKLSGTTVTVSKASLNDKNVTVSDGYTLKLGSNVTKSTTKNAWSLKSSTATYKQTKYKSGLSVSGNVITLKNSALTSKVTVSGGYEFDFASDYTKSSITGSNSNDTITARGKNISINGGKGNDSLWGGAFSSSSFKNGNLTLAISGGGSVVFDGVSSGDTFNINNKTYKISGSKLAASN